MNARILLVVLPFVALIALPITGLAGLSASAQSQSTIGLFGADAVVEGNTSTSLGPRDPCVRTEVGSTVPIDFTVDAVPQDRPIAGFQLNIIYNSDLLEVVQVDTDFLLGATGQYQPLAGLSDPLPDADGNYKVAVVDIASNSPAGANMETGPGVISRVTFRAKAAGRSDVAPGFEANREYPGLIDNQNTTIGVDAIASTVVAIGEDCGAVSAEDQVQPLPPLADLIGTPAPTGQTTAPTGTLAPGQTTPSPTEAPGPTEIPSPTARDNGEQDHNGDDGPAFSDSGDDDSDTGSFIAAVLLGTLGAALASAGGVILYRRAHSDLDAPTTG